MENVTKTFLTIVSELERIRKELGYSRNDFAIAFNVSPFTVDAWFKRNVEPSAHNTFQIVKFLKEIRQTQRSVGLYVLPDRALKNSTPIRLKTITNSYCNSNRLEMVAYKFVDANNLYNAESIFDYFTTDYLKSNLITDLVYYSKSISLANIKKKELKDAGIRVLHNIVNNRVNIEKL